MPVEIVFRTNRYERTQHDANHVQHTDDLDVTRVGSPRAITGRHFDWDIDFTSPRAVRNSSGSVVPFSTSAAFSVGWAETAVGVLRRFPRAEVGVLAAAADWPSRWALVVTPIRLTPRQERTEKRMLGEDRYIHASIFSPHYRLVGVRTSYLGNVSSELLDMPLPCKQSFVGAA